MTVDDKEEYIEFKWGKMKAKGGRNKDIPLYESFTYDGVEYSLFDSVYVYKEGEEEPYIGKLIKIWETVDKMKKVKLLWFFRPCEIVNFLPTDEIQGNELFLASGEGSGLTNINPLEVLVGKCNVICISKDRRNPQPPDEEVKKAEYVFHRVFDVGRRQVIDRLDDKIAGYDVKFLLNKIDRLKPVDAKESLVDPKSSLGEKPTSNVGLSEACKSNIGFLPTIDDKSMPMVKANGNEYCNASMVKQNSSDEKQFASVDGLERKSAKGYDRSKTILGEKNVMRSQIDEGGKHVAIGGSNRQDVEVDENTNDTHGLVEDKNGKKTKPGDSKSNLNAKRGDGVHRRRLVHDNDEDNVEASGLNVTSLKDKHKLRLEKDSSDVEGTPSKRLKLQDKPTKLSQDKLHKESSTKSPNGEQKIDSSECEVTQRLDADTYKGLKFKGFTWEDRLKSAHEQGRLVLLQNLDPSLTSQEVEDLVRHAFQENCMAKIIQATAFSSPHCGQAFVIFRRKEVAEEALRKLNKSCLLMSNGRPLVGSPGNPCFPQKRRKFVGHIVIDQIRMTREMKDAICTAHCSKPNNVEHDLAMDWCLLQERTDYAWRKLFQRQGEELKKVRAKLKAK